MQGIKGVVTGIVVIFVSLVLFAIIITQSDTAIAAVNASANTYTGVGDFLLLVPLLVLLGLMGYGGWTVVSSARGMGRSRRR